MHGQIDVAAVGRIDSHNGGIRALRIASRRAAEQVG